MDFGNFSFANHSGATGKNSTLCERNDKQCLPVVVAKNATRIGVFVLKKTMKNCCREAKILFYATC